jgi:hypothetical protein
MAYRGRNRNTAKAGNPGPEAVEQPQHTPRHADAALDIVGRRLAACARSCGYEGQCYAADTALEEAHHVRDKVQAARVFTFRCCHKHEDTCL